MALKLGLFIREIEPCFEEIHFEEEEAFVGWSTVRFVVDVCFEDGLK